MAENRFVVCTVRTAARMQEIVEELFERDKYVIFTWKVGQTSTMPQKALFHIWLRTWCAFLLHKEEKEVTEADLAGMKRSVKARYYHDSGAEFMVEEIADPMAPSKRRMEYTSVANWTPGECFAVMEWMQGRAAEQGLILESKGEFQHLKTGQHR